MKKGKHASNRITFFGIKHGKHSKNEMMVYNPIFSKLSTCMSSFAVATSFLACATLGKYKGTYASQDTARAAKYEFNLISNETSITEFIPNTTRSISFEISNFNGDKKSEVALRYFIKIDNLQNIQLPLEYKLYRLTNNGNTQTEIPLTNGESEYIEVSTMQETHTYRLDIIWPDGLNEVTYGNLTDNIKVLVEVEQLD